MKKFQVKPSELWTSISRELLLDLAIFQDFNWFSDHLLVNFSIINILGFEPTYWVNRKLQTKELTFCIDIVLDAIKAFTSAKYTCFDGLTTTNCCHGLANLARIAICSLVGYDLCDIKEELSVVRKKLSMTKKPIAYELQVPIIPLALLYLSVLFTLSYIRDEDPVKGSRTVQKKLMDYANFSHTFCKKIVFNLQKAISNMVAETYRQLNNQDLDTNYSIHGVPYELWRKYVADHYIREDIKGLKYSSSLYSMQLVLDYLTKNKAKIAIMQAIKDENNAITDCRTILFEGNAVDQFICIGEDKLYSLYMACGLDPVLVFAGFTSKNQSDADGQRESLDRWLNNIAALILACDMHYPQFPRVTDDVNFCDDPILPIEGYFQDILEYSYQIHGVSIEDASVFCLSHIYPASLKQVLVQKFQGMQARFSTFMVPELSLE